MARHRPSPAIAHVRARIANRVRFHGPTDPQLPGLRRDLRILELVEHFQKVINDRPPLSDAQRAKLAILLEPAREQIFADYLADAEVGSQFDELERGATG